MTTPTIVWTISQLDCYPQVGNETDVVFTVHWQCTGTQDTYTASVYSTCAIPAPDPADFVPYDKLTQDMVLGWIWEDGVDRFATELAVVQQIDAQINPTVVSPPLPWSSAPQTA
jgi:hypothetical protein